jgi:broad specificity phosphatase PhoE
MTAPHHEVWLIRHGETAWSKSGQHTSRTDLPLTATGRRRAAMVGRRLADRQFALVLTSSLDRARETCRLAGYGNVAQVDDDLLEWDYGAYEGRTTEDIQEGRPGWTIWNGGVPEGETADQVGNRAKRVIERAEAAGGDVALFSSGHILRVLTACWVGLPPLRGQDFALGTSSVSVLGYEHDYPVILRWNQSYRLFEVK